MIWFAVTIFWSAFLLFLVQPILGKQILPWFGGTPAVWTTCLLFFQLLLLGGYVYAHGVTAWLKPRGQALLHIGLLACSLWFLPIAADPAYRESAEQAPTWEILGLLAFTVGAPYLMISATGPLLQAWFAHAHARSPYRLYALSNVGSLLALLSYPFLVEPNLHVSVQAQTWSWGYLLFVLVCMLCAAQVLRTTFVAQEHKAGELPDDTVNAVARPRSTTMLLWLGLSASASTMLMATTNQICQEVAVVPFLWILPLTLYLLSFIVCFDSPRWYDRRLFLPLLAVAMALATAMLFVGVRAPLLAQIGTYLVALFAAVMACHGELFRARPAARHLTLFYLVIATGGAVGGIFVALVAPKIFDGYWEYHLAIVACSTCVVCAWSSDPKRRIEYRRLRWLAPVLFLAVAALATALAMQASAFRRGVISASRNFYGVLRVRDERDPGTGLRLRKMVHGVIWHGTQLLDEVHRRQATTYYAADSGIGLAMKHHPGRQQSDSAARGLKVGVVGLGTGTLAALAHADDTLRFYEINPDVIRVAQDEFYYLADTPAAWTIAEGDARRELEKELAASGPQQFDILVMDAFSSDAIPMHLLTRECVEMYWRHLRPDGLLMINIRNRNVDLVPVVQALRAVGNKEARVRHAAADPSQALFSSSWAIVTSNQAFLDTPGVAELLEPLPEVPPVVWTDDYGSLWQVLRSFEFSAGQANLKN